MRLPIDTEAVRFVSAEPPEQALDFDTKQPLADAEGNLVFKVHLFAVGAGAVTRSPSRWPASPRAWASSPRSR